MADKNRINAMGCDVRVLVLVLAVCMAFGADNATAKPLYVIADIVGTDFIVPIQAYDIGTDGTLTFQTQCGVPLQGNGAVGLAVDPSSKYIFITYEDSNIIRLLHATAMTDAGFVTVSSATNLAGTVFSQSANLLYCVERKTSKLYALRWNPSTAALTLIPSSPFTLADATAYGIALDETNDLLYVTNGTDTINVYRTLTWDFVRTIKVSKTAIGIALDVKNGLIYLGGGYADNFYLTQYNLSTGIEKEVRIEPDAGVMGLAVDPATGFVYMSTGRNNEDGGNSLLVYDSELKRIDSVPGIGSATGIVIPNIDVGYNPLNLTKNLIGAAGNDNGGTNLVHIGETVTYTISFDARAYQPGSISIIDTIPRELSFISADGYGVFGFYDTALHRYTWLNPPMATGGPTYLDLIVRANPDVKPGTVVTNWVTINTDKTWPTKISVDAIVIESGLSLSKSIIGYSASPDTGGGFFVNPGDIVAYSIGFDNSSNGLAINNVAFVDTLPYEVSFLSADGDGLFGQYDFGTQTYTWSYPSIPAGAHTCLRLVVKVGDTAAIGKTLTNSVVTVIAGEEVKDSDKSVNTTVKKAVLDPLNLSKSIIGGFADTNTGNGRVHVNPGDTIAYAIYFDNNNNNQAVNDVSIVDILPREVSFIAADGDGVFGEYDGETHSYVWHYSSVPAGSSACVKLIVRLALDMAPGTTVTNFAIIDSNSVKATTSSIDAVVGEVLYNPLQVTKSLVGAVSDPNTGVTYVNAGDTLIYSISFNNLDNTEAVTNVSVMDILPMDVALIAADGTGASGEYDALSHTYKWTHPSLAAGAGAYVTLVVQVDSNTAPGTRVRNFVITDNDKVQAGLATVEAVVKETARNPLNLTKNVVSPAVGGGSSGEMTYVHPGDTVTYAICFDNNDNVQAVNNVKIVDMLSEQVTFVRADGDGVFGHYDPNTHTYLWSYQSVPADSNACLNLTVRVKEGIALGTKITNSAILYGYETRSTLAAADVTTYYNPLHISKTVTNGANGAGGCVDVNESITYTICFDNNDNDQAVSNVKIVDSLPQEVIFRSADGNGVFGQYDPAKHTYTWSYSSVAPGSRTCLNLVARIKPDTAEKKKVTNSVAISGQGVITATAVADVVTCERLKAKLLLLPTSISPRSGFSRVAAIVLLPEGISRNDVKLEPLTLTPSGIKSSVPVSTYVWGKSVRIVTAFEKRDLVAAVGTGGKKILRVTGKLKSGMTFYADGVIGIGN